MAVYQEATTASATRPPLRAAPNPRDVSYWSAHLPSPLTATMTGVLAVVVGAWGGIGPFIGHAIGYSLMDRLRGRGRGISSTGCFLSSLAP
jgi:hypothetical protein